MAPRQHNDHTRNADFIALTQRVKNLLEKQGFRQSFELNEKSITTDTPAATWMFDYRGESYPVTVSAHYEGSRLTKLGATSPMYAWQSIVARNGPSLSQPLHLWSNAEVARKTCQKIIDLFHAQRPRNQDKVRTYAA